MEAIKQIVRTPKNHQIKIKIPDHVTENDPVEIILFFRQKPSDFDKRIDALKGAMKDELFLSDLQEVSEDFEKIDIEEWQE